jgi:hypothetical protein
MTLFRNPASPDLNMPAPAAALEALRTGLLDRRADGEAAA